MGNFLSKLSGVKMSSIHPFEPSVTTSDEWGVGEEIEEDEANKIYVRLACGKIETYYGFHTFKNGSKILIDKEKNWRTGPFKNLDKMLVDKNALPYRYVHPYEKDINGNMYISDSGDKSNCKNCEAYGIWEKVGNDIMICAERCLSCRKQQYFYKVMRIQRKWRHYKNNDTKFEWDRLTEAYVPVIV